MQLEEPTNFSTEPIKWYFAIDGISYVVKEASEDAYTSYRNATMQHLKVIESKEGNQGSFTGGAEADTILVTKCLFKVEKNGEAEREVPVPIHFVKGLKRSITSRLYQWIRKNSGMDEEQETVEFLTKRIQDDTKKLERLKKDGGVLGKDGSSSTETI